MRQSWDSYFMLLAQMAAERSTCPRAKVGAVIVKDKKIVSTGYNGSASGEWHCLDENVGCEIVGGHCIRAIHAEVNALLFAGFERAQEATLYVTHLPCWNCSGMIINAGVKRVVYWKDYGERHTGRIRLQNAEIRVEKLDNGCGKEGNDMERNENV